MVSTLGAWRIPLFVGWLVERSIERLNNWTPMRRLTPTWFIVYRQVAARSAATAAAAHNHGKMWAFERVITVSLIGLIPASFVMYHPSLDYILALGLCLHSHWGLHGICCDYIRPKLFGAPLAKLAELIVYLFSILAFGSVMYFNYTDVGLIHAFRALWKL